MRALVLSGGGVKGAYQVGALKKWLLEDGRDYDILCGVSVGALNVSFLSQAPLGNIAEAYKKLADLWGTITDDKVRKSRCFGMLSALWSVSVYKSHPLVQLINESLDVKAVAASGRKVRVGCTSWSTGEYRLAEETDPDFAKWVAASASFPVFLEPVEVDGQLWTDGGVRSVTPLGTAIRLGADEIDVIMCTNPDIPNLWDPAGQHAIPGFLERTVDLMSDEIIRADLKVCGLKNDIAEMDPKYKKVSVRVLQPSRKLVLDSLAFDPEAIREMIATGYKDACQVP
jgi:NTE family protein